MECEKESSVCIARKLLEGEHVEVLQRGVGLRGSWHPAKVVRVKHGRRVVEYEDLLTADGKGKLCESIYLSKDLKYHSPSLRLKNERTAAEPAKRGLIRPLPPPCAKLASSNWKSGLFVDAFYEGAWWEGILLDEVLLDHMDSRVKVYFPEEGDELQVLVTDLRVSQEWDEELGDWEVCGCWPLYSKIGEADVSPFKQVSHRYFLKKLWRQRRIDRIQDVQLEELKRLQLSVAPSLQNNLPAGGVESGTCQEKSIVGDENSSLILKEAANWQDLQERVLKPAQPLHSPVSSKAALCSGKERLEGNRGLCQLRVTRRAAAPVQGIEEHPLPALRKLPNVCSEHAIDIVEEKLLPTSSPEKWLLNLGLQGNMINAQKDNGKIAQQSEFFSSATLPSDCIPYLGLQQNHFASVQDAFWKVNGAISDERYIPHKVRIRQARQAAKRYLLNAGWTFDVRNRARGHAVKQEAVYVSPSGSRFFSLAAACRGLKSCERSSSQVETRSKELELLNAYHVSEEFESLKSLSDRLAKAKLLDSLPTSEGNTPLWVTDGELYYLPGSPINIVEERKKKTEKQKKRKNEMLDVSSPPEVKRKRVRHPLKKGGASLLQDSKGSRGRGGCRMEVLLSFPGKEKDLDCSKDTGDLSQFKKSTVLSWLMDKGILRENEPVSYLNRKDGHVMKKGHVTREGVICDCCKDVFTLSNFEAHAGSKLHRPSANTFLDDGRSISDCQLEACALQDAKENQALMEINDETCCVCGDGGQLILCDHCPLTFHADCIGLEVIPEGDWFCPRCSCGICGSHQLAEQDLDKTMLHCAQCELQYHLVCAQEHTIITHAGAEMVFWFCNRQCREIFTALRRLVGISHPMEGGFAWTLLRSMKKDQGLLPSCLEDMAEHHSKLSVAHGVMQECFVPMIDPRTKINLVSQALYNRSSKLARLNYAGFYTILLEKGDEVISVATIRVHGARLAEMPLVGTRFQYRRRGMCRRLLHALEEMLKSIGVEKLILPAVPELLETWTGAFNFQKINLQESQELSKLSLMTFPGTTLLKKNLPAGANNATNSMSLRLVSDQADSNENPLCNSVEHFFSMARASLDCGLLERKKAVLAGESVNHAGAISSACSFRPQPVQPFSPLGLQSSVTWEGSNGCYVLSNGGKSKNHCKSRDHHGSSGDALVTNKIRSDEDINTRVVIATTRSNRLVKSRRWVADGLKELKNTKQSKRTFATPSTGFESAVELACGDLFETLGHVSNSPEGGFTIENFYTRTRRKTPLVSVEAASINGAQISQATECTTNVVVDSMKQNHRMQDDSTTDIMNGKSINISWDEGFKFGGYRDGFCAEPPRLVKELREDLSTCPNFYSRRKKRESFNQEFVKETSRQITELVAQKQTPCSVVEGSLQSFRASFTLPIKSSLITDGVHGQANVR